MECIVMWNWIFSLVNLLLSLAFRILWSSFVCNGVHLPISGDSNYIFWCQESQHVNHIHSLSQLKSREYLVINLNRRKSFNWTDNEICIEMRTILKMHEQMNQIRLQTFTMIERLANGQSDCMQIPDFNMNFQLIFWNIFSSVWHSKCI